MSQVTDAAAVLAPRLKALHELEMHEAEANGTLVGAAFSCLCFPHSTIPFLANARRRVLADKTRALIRHDRRLRGEM